MVDDAPLKRRQGGSPVESIDLTEFRVRGAVIEEQSRQFGRAAFP